MVHKHVATAALGPLQSVALKTWLDEMVKLELIRNTMRIVHLYPYHKRKFKQEQQAQWQQRMQRKEAKPTREEQERLRKQLKERAQDMMQKHEEAWMGNFERIYPDDDPAYPAVAPNGWVRACYCKKMYERHWLLRQAPHKRSASRLGKVALPTLPHAERTSTGS